MYYDERGLDKYVSAQARDYDDALREIRSGRKRSHWIWYIFPQLDGLGYSPTNSVTLMIGGKVKGVSLGYSYEAFTNGVSLGNGSHELFVGYQTDLNLFKKGRNRHQSVRIL